MFHDFGHFLMKDLIFTGKDSPLHRGVYIISRMISEAITIMMADGVFVNTLAQAKIEYDWTTRHIYPLFSDTGLDFSDKDAFVANLKTLTKASVDYTVKGNDNTFRELISKAGNTSENLELYTEKYKPFFISDYEWTAHNYSNMSNRADEMRRWWAMTSPLRSLLVPPLETIDEFISSMSMFCGGDGVSGSEREGSTDADTDTDLSFSLVDRVFETIFERRIAPIFCARHQGGPSFKEPQLLDECTRRRRGFLRWIIGQVSIIKKIEGKNRLSLIIYLFIYLFIYIFIYLFIFTTVLLSADGRWEYSRGSLARVQRVIIFLNKLLLLF